jgi:serine protease
MSRFRNGSNGLATKKPFSGRYRDLWVLSAAATILVGSPLRAQDADDLLPRAVPQKPAETRVAPGDDYSRVVLKFREGTYVRLRDDRLEVDAGESAAAPEAVDLSAFDSILADFGISSDAIEPLHTRPETELNAERTLAQRQSGRELADLNLYYTIDLPPGIDVGNFCDQLNSLPFVELATPTPKPALPPIDIPPPTPDFSGMQGYRGASPGGIGALDPALVPGGDGAGTTVVDVEYSWVLEHEDLELDASANIDTQATLSDPFNDTNHGTAVLGELGGGANGYGVTGIVPATTLLVAPANTLELGYNPARAISLATGILNPGDAILIEQQTAVCGGSCGIDQIGCGPLEWQQPVFDAIATATALGIIVVEAAGNGNVDLDSPNCLGRFDRSVRDSGAIIVGAGDSQTRARLSFSSYGSRVDLQGWGNNVTTSGYGDLFNPGDERQEYTSSFGGTSSASPIGTGAVLAIQGAVMEMGFAPLDPLELRQALVDTGRPQTGPAENIGPLPDIARSLAAITAEAAVAVDIRPRQCPNVVRGHGRGNLPAAILGSDRLDVRDIDVSSIRLAGVRPQHKTTAFRDVATPFEPLLGKKNARDCTREGPDGFKDLLVRFELRSVVKALGQVSKGEVVVVPLTGELQDGTPIRGEDVLLVAHPHSRPGPRLEAGLSPGQENGAGAVSGMEDGQ